MTSTSPEFPDELRKIIKDAFDNSYRPATDLIRPKRTQTEGLKEHFVHSAMCYALTNAGYFLYPEWPVGGRDKENRGSWGSIDLVAVKKDYSSLLICEWKRFFRNEEKENIKYQTKRMIEIKDIKTLLNSIDPQEHSEFENKTPTANISYLWILIDQELHSNEAKKSSLERLNEFLNDKEIPKKNWEYLSYPKKPSGNEKAAEPWICAYAK